jgi:predicted type IV restriction endonuclease
MIGLFKEFKTHTVENKIETAIKQQIARLVKQVESGKRNEEETRLWIIDFLKSGLGYNDQEIETEVKMLGKRADIVLKELDRIFLVIECKAANVKLTKAAINQAAAYAISVGASWAVVTNGQRWRLFHVSPTKGVEPDITQLFDIELLDADGLSKDDIFYLSLLEKNSLNKGEARELYHAINAVSIKRIRDEISHPDVVRVLCKRLEERYKRNMGVTVTVDSSDLFNVIDDAFNILDAFINDANLKNIG